MILNLLSSSTKKLFTKKVVVGEWYKFITATPGKVGIAKVIKILGTNQVEVEEYFEVSVRPLNSDWYDYLPYAI